ncbi:MAG: DNA replication/repair protein RecF [Lacisediminihabitans sp.]
MIAKHLSLSNFRNYESAEVRLAAGPNVFVGSNGQGKTNLVESLGYLSTLGSHRFSVDNAMIRQGAEAAIIRARLEHGDRQLLVEVQINRSGANRAQINRSVIKTRDLPRYFSSILFAPEDLALIRGEPSVRRRFLDELLVQRSPRFSGVISDYERVIKQRNTLLKSARSTGIKGDRLSTLEIWDERLVTLGSELIEARTLLVAKLLPDVIAAYESIVGEDHRVSVANYLTVATVEPGSDIEPDVEPGGVSSRRVRAGTAAMGAEEAADGFRSALGRLRRAELDRGITLVGPHRDDLILELNGLPARGYASHGESWSFALALKLAAANLLRRESTSGDPVLMLDDVFAELDESRRTRLAAAVQGFDQVLITAAVYEDVPRTLTANTVRIAHGIIQESGS